MQGQSIPYDGVLTPKERTVLSEDEFADVKIAQLDREFMSGPYALSHKISPKEVNLAVMNPSYAAYIEAGVAS